jgi:hypothetical protein
MVLVDSRRVPRVPRYSGACHEPHHFCLRGFHRLWPIIPDGSASGSVSYSPALNRTGPTTPIDPKTYRFGLIRFRSPLLTKSLNCFLFLQVLRWFTSLSLLQSAYVFSREILHFQRSGFPHSETPGSTPVCGFPRIIAAYHVLHRLLSPRHPPCALSSLIITCLRRSLYIRTRNCRVCPSIFNCQRPQISLIQRIQKRKGSATSRLRSSQPRVQT